VLSEPLGNNFTKKNHPTRQSAALPASTRDDVIIEFDPQLGLEEQYYCIIGLISTTFMEETGTEYLEKSLSSLDLDRRAASCPWKRH
jgi:hypothetical protein